MTAENLSHKALFRLAWIGALAFFVCSCGPNARQIDQATQRAEAAATRAEAAASRAEASADQAQAAAHRAEEGASIAEDAVRRSNDAASRMEGTAVEYDVFDLLTRSEHEQ
jgi:hypothetical protein